MDIQVGHLALFCLFSVIDSSRRFWKGSLCKGIQFMLELLKAPLFVLCINDLSDVNCNIAIYADDNKFYSKCDQAFDLWQLRELAF